MEEVEEVEEVEGGVIGDEGEGAPAADFNPAVAVTAAKPAEIDSRRASISSGGALGGGEAAGLGGGGAAMSWWR